MTEPVGTLGDLHSHLVPGVDDGARTLDEALEAVDAMVAVGIGRVVTTPHFRASLLQDEDACAQRIDEVERSFERLREAVRTRHSTLRLERGFEILLDVPDPDFSDPRVRLAGTPYVLVEWPRMRILPGTAAVLTRIREAGWTPVVAHPERYHGMDAELRRPLQWRQAGALLQVNHGSVVGRYGTEARSRALRLLQAGVVDVLSTDHHPRPGHGLEVEAVREFFREADAEESFARLTDVNPGRLMDGEAPLEVPGFALKKSLLGRLGNILGGRS
ncbi:MAG TPA: CpsB/CapC family capsule biosynthesis tyrosine phosphatase [Longimicrobiales bacterium]|nr:CpsB/CapC family capsule biosynthesis tyrosine phosphatase [Longimicrobiales bacterium]